jgi:putative membrane protein
MAVSGRGSASDFLAAERTFLAWIRTGLALMGFGFVVARFGLFLREIALTTHSRPIESGGLSVWIGTALLLLGAAVNVAASIHHVHLIGRIDRGEQIGQPSTNGLILAITLAVFALAMAAYLVLMG